MDERQKQRIGIFSAGALLLFALLFDLLQLALTLTVIFPILLGWLAVGILWLWFKLLGVKYFEGKNVVAKILAAAAPVIVAVIPIVNDIPDLTLSTGILIAIVYFEDKKLVEPAVEFYGKLQRAGRAIGERRDARIAKARGDANEASGLNRDGSPKQEAERIRQPLPTEEEAA